MNHLKTVLIIYHIAPPQKKVGTTGVNTCKDTVLIPQLARSVKLVEELHIQSCKYKNITLCI